MRNYHRIAAAATLTLITGAGGALAQHAPDSPRREMSHAVEHDSRMPTQPGQEAFATIKEIVRILETDPHTDWSRVNIPALREHLIDMSEVTLNAHAKPEPIPGGLRIAVTGEGRTRAAIRRMVTMHARVIDGRNGWSVSARPSANGVMLTVTASNPKEVAKIRGLGFMGIMVSGSHHQMHHLAIARGQMTY
ncbi:MAG TPA: hypothetical protein VKA14_00745 [Gammaproteobacteria bacterium]|nr:hypothetical protein [Gammaproteobacteria bacterium]